MSIQNIMAEVSIHPLRIDSLSGLIKAFIDVLRSEPGLDINVGNMSTQVVGESNMVFLMLEKAFSSVAKENECVMTVKVSNACPYSPPDQE
ncbi:MAG: thiamine-binding protein [Deltaproteobacteria bacterium]|nr:thiamine-binding protein [Deltaproteobacteria bacterium]